MKLIGCPYSSRGIPDTAPVADAYRRCMNNSSLIASAAGDSPLLSQVKEAIPVMIIIALMVGTLAAWHVIMSLALGSLR